MIVDMFSVPVYYTTLEKHEIYKKTFLSFVEDDQYFQEAKNWDSKTETTFMHPLNQTLPWRDLVNDVSTHLFEYMKIFDPHSKYRIGTDAWLNRYKFGGYQEQHNHVGEKNFFSCAYMLDVPDDSGKFVFVDTNLDFYASVGFYKVFNIVPSRAFIPPLKEGDLIIFPSYMDHYVTKNNTDRVRSTISMNFTLEPIIENNI
jgi:uncharacterized protein (TIGR02466 family)